MSHPRDAVLDIAGREVLDWTAEWKLRHGLTECESRLILCRILEDSLHREAGRERDAQDGKEVGG